MHNVSLHLLFPFKHVQIIICLVSNQMFCANKTQLSVYLAFDVVNKLSFFIFIAIACKLMGGLLYFISTSNHELRQKSMTLTLELYDLILMSCNALVNCNHGPQALGNSGDFDFCPADQKPLTAGTPSW